ncbi:effector binding domain-containing protein [Nocardia sp. AG03]|uniref:GyrI-like domain-containing protein n=1 Tax=Nocardia sp. AG03 TaxID=3025312 RepID=UPI0024182CCD|nr:effector binding domain-containing protein [Nocardia sp. AG03]
MDFNVVDRPETLIAGTVLRSPALAVEGPRRAKVVEAWRHLLARPQLPGPVATGYVDFAAEINSYLTHIVGYECKTLADLQVGDVLARIPAGRYARFAASGENRGDVIVALWRQIWDAEAAGEFDRAYAGDYELYPDDHSVEIFVSLNGEKGGE